MPLLMLIRISIDAKFGQGDKFQSKNEKMNITIKFCILE